MSSQILVGFLFEDGTFHAMRSPLGLNGLIHAHVRAVLNKPLSILVLVGFHRENHDTPCHAPVARLL